MNEFRYIIMTEASILWGLGILIGLMTWIIMLLIAVDKRTSNIQVWQFSHEAQDNQRHAENLQRFDKIFNKLDDKVDKGDE